MKVSIKNRIIIIIIVILIGCIAKLMFPIISLIGWIVGCVIYQSIDGYSELARVQSLYDDEVGINQRLRNDYKELLEESSLESGKLSRNLAIKEKELLDLETNLRSIKGQNEQLAQELEKRNLNDYKWIFDEINDFKQFLKKRHERS